MGLLSFFWGVVKPDAFPWLWGQGNSAGLFRRSAIRFLCESRQAAVHVALAASPFRFGFVRRIGGCGRPRGRGAGAAVAGPALPALHRKTRRRRPKAAGVTARFARPPPPPPGRSEPREERQALSFCQENNPLIQAQTCWKMFVSSCPFAASAWGVGVGMGSSGSISSMV